LLSAPAVAIFAIACVVGFKASTLLFLPNPWPVRLGAPVLVFILAYSFAKRFTILAHFWLGASLMLAPVAAWIAIRGLEDLLAPTILGLAVLTWVAGFDILYACQDVEVDRRQGLKSVPAALGVSRALHIARICHAITVAFLVALFWVASPPLGWVYLAGVVAVAALLVYEHRLVRPDDLGRVNKAFFQVNAVISIGLFLLVLVQVAVK
jgi:4-hydroxybenzoate polyprenyltransferase